MIGQEAPLRGRFPPHAVASAERSHRAFSWRNPEFPLFSPAIRRKLAQPGNPLEIDGHSLVSFLRSGPAPKREVFYWELHDKPKPIQAVRFGDWKAVKNGAEAKIEFYDLSSDPGESRDVAGQHPDQVVKAIGYFASEKTDNPDWPMDGNRPKFTLNLRP